jgi:hypothetical protein
MRVFRQCRQHRGRTRLHARALTHSRRSMVSLCGCRCVYVCVRVAWANVGAHTSSQSQMSAAGLALLISYATRLQVLMRVLRAQSLDVVMQCTAHVTVDNVCRAVVVVDRDLCIRHRVSTRAMTHQRYASRACQRGHTPSRSSRCSMLCGWRGVRPRQRSLVYVMLLCLMCMSVCLQYIFSCVLCMLTSCLLSHAQVSDAPRVAAALSLRLHALHHAAELL